MTLKKRLIQGAAVLALAAAAQAQAQEVILKVHHIWPTVAMGHQRVVVPWCEAIAKDSNNRMRCQILPAMTGGGTPAQLVDRVKDGVDDLVVTLPGYTPGRFPIMEALELPFMTNTAESASAAAWDYYSKYATKEFTGTKILATWVHDEGFVSTSNKSIRTMDDFKGLKIRAASRQSSKLLARLGATPVGMPIPPVADAMTKGTIDGFMTAWEIIPAFKLHEVSKFHTEIEPSRPSMFTAGFVMAMNQAKYDKLSAEDKKAVDAISGETAARIFGRGWDKVDRRAFALMQVNGVQVTKADAKFVADIKSKTAPLEQGWIKAAEAKGLKNPAKVLSDFRAEIAKLEK